MNTHELSEIINKKVFQCRNGISNIRLITDLARDYPNMLTHMDIAMAVVESHLKGNIIIMTYMDPRINCRPMQMIFPGNIKFSESANDLTYPEDKSPPPNITSIKPSKNVFSFPDWTPPSAA
jgi:hypothetical protein